MFNIKSCQGYRLKALNTLLDLLKDSQTCSQIINKMNVVTQLGLVLQHSISTAREDEIATQSCTNLILVATFQNGALLILKDEQLMIKRFELAKVLCEELSVAASVVLSTMTVFPTIAFRMLQLEYLPKVKQILVDLNMANEHLLSVLISLIAESPEQALNAGLFDCLLTKLRVENHCQPMILLCFALIQSRSCRETCDRLEVIKYLFDILVNKKLNNSVYEFAGMALQNCTLGIASRIYVRMNLMELPANGARSTCPNKGKCTTSSVLSANFTANYRQRFYKENGLRHIFGKS